MVLLQRVAEDANPPESLVVYLSKVNDAHRAESFFKAFHNLIIGGEGEKCIGIGRSGARTYQVPTSRSIAYAFQL